MISSLNFQNDLLESALSASIVKNDVILNNISNVDTPNFKKKQVDFDNLLKDAIDSAKISKTIDLKSIKPQIKLVHKDFKGRIDGNNVDMDSEMVDLYKNSLKYDTMISSVTNNYKRINLVIRAR